jgi:hypothetical protein
VTLVFAGALGVYSHFIHLAVTGGLLLAALSCATRRPSARAVQLAVAQAAAAAFAATVAVMKLAVLPKDARAAAPLLAVPALGLAVAIAVAAAVARPGVAAKLEAVFVRRAKLVGRVLRVVVGLGAAVFVAVHLLALLDALANDALERRIYSVAMPAPLAVLSYGLAALAVGRVVYVLWRPPADMTPAQHLVVALPVCAAAMLPIVVTSNSIRYYVVQDLLVLAAASVAVELLGPRKRWAARAAIALYAAVVDAGVVPMQLDARHHEAVTPMRFRFGYEDETSAHFFPTDAIAGRLREERRRLVTNDGFLLGLPIAFQRRVVEGAKVQEDGGEARVDYDYARAGGIAYVAKE